MDKCRTIFYETRSVRKYSEGNIDKNVIEKIIESAGQAPSGLNKQPWLYAVVLNKELKAEIRIECEKVENKFYMKMGKQSKEYLDMVSIKKEFLTTAPALVIMFAENTAPYYEQSAWLSAAWFILAAKMEGISTLTYTPENMRFLNKMLNIEEKYEPQIIFPLGYGEKKGNKNRKPLKEISRYYE